MFIFPYHIYIYIYIVKNNPNWLIFFRGVGQPPTSHVSPWWKHVGSRIQRSSSMQSLVIPSHWKSTSIVWSIGKSPRSTMVSGVCYYICYHMLKIRLVKGMLFAQGCGYWHRQHPECLCEKLEAQTGLDWICQWGTHRLWAKSGCSKVDARRWQLQWPEKKGQIH